MDARTDGSSPLAGSSTRSLPVRRGLLTHEWIEPTGGSEKVLDQFALAFPDAPIACLWDGDPGRYPDRTVEESPLARTPLRGRKTPSAPLLPAVWTGRWHEHHEAEWILTSSHTFAHHIAASRHGRSATTYAYVHTPARFLWAPEVDPRAAHPVARALGPVLRSVDRRRAQYIDHIAVNSRYVRERVRRAWGRDARVIYPPVAVDELRSVPDWRTRVVDPAERRLLGSLPETFVLGASRMVAYKRLDLVIEAGAAAGLPVVVAGSGPESERLGELAAAANVPVLLTGRVSDALLRALMQLALVYLYPPVEDFGIMPVEAMALGTPVVVGHVGGARESVEAVGLGVVVDASDRRALADAVAAGASRRGPALADAAAQFSETRFRAQVRDWVTAAGIPATLA